MVVLSMVVPRWWASMATTHTLVELSNGTIIRRLNHFTRSLTIGQIGIEKTNLWNETITELSFLKISYSVEQIPMDHIEMKNSLESKLQVYSVCSNKFVLKLRYGRKLTAPYFQPFCKLLKQSISILPFLTASTFSPCLVIICFLTNSGPLNFLPDSGHKYFSGANCCVFTSINFFTSSSCSFCPSCFESEFEILDT